MKIIFPIYEINQISDKKVQCKIIFYLKSEIFEEKTIGRKLAKKYKLKNLIQRPHIKRGLITAITTCHENDTFDLEKGKTIAKIKATTQLFNLTRCITRDYVEYIEQKKQHYISQNIKNDNAYHCEKLDFEKYCGSKKS